MKKIISYIILFACILKMILPMSIIYAEENEEYECIQLPIISDQLKGTVKDITLYEKDDILYIPLDIVCSLINAEWYMKDGGFYVSRDNCMYFRYYSNGNMKLIVDLGVGDDKWNKSDNVLLEGNLFSCKKIDIVWYVDFIKFCDMFGVTFRQVSQSTIQSAKNNIKKNVTDSAIEKLSTLDIEKDLDFKNNPYYIYLYAGTPLTSLYAKVMGSKNLYLWDYSCYENLNLSENEENWFKKILKDIQYSDVTQNIVIQSQNYCSNIINDDWGITKILSPPPYDSSEHYKTALVNISGINYGEHLKKEDIESINQNNKAQELERLLNSNTIISSSDSTIKILNKYLNDQIKIPELEAFTKISDVVNCIGTPFQTYFEIENFHNKLNSISEDKIQLLTKSIIENENISNASTIQGVINNSLNISNAHRPAVLHNNILLNSIDNYAGLMNSSKEICSLYRNSDKQFQDKLYKSIKSGAYAIGDTFISKTLEESGDPYLILACAVIGVYDGFTTWTKENFGAQLQNSEILVQAYFIERTMKERLDIKNPENLYNRLTLMLQSSLCCFKYDEKYFQTNRNKISKMLYILDNDKNINIDYYHDPRNNNVNENIKKAILNFSDNKTDPTANYEWYLFPTIEAEDIIVSDNSDEFYTITPYSKEIEKASDKYSVIKIDGKYSFIEYDGNMPIKEKYDKYNFFDAGEICLNMNNSYQVDLAVDGHYENHKAIINNYPDGWGRGASGGYTNFFYDSQNNTIWAEEMGILPFDGYISIYNTNVKKPVVFQQAIISDTEIEKGYLKNSDINTTGKYGVYYDNNITIEPIYDDGFISLYNDIVVLKKDNQWYYFDGKTGKKLFDIPIVLNSSKISVDGMPFPYAFCDGYVALYTNDGCGYYDMQGNEIIPCGTFEEIRPVHNGLAWVKQDGKWGVIKLKNIETEINTSNNSEELFTGTVNTEKDPLNVRKSPSTEAKIIGKIDKGSTVTIYSENGDWYEIEYNGGVGYVSKKYIRNKDNNSDEQTSSISDSEILKAVNKYLKENQSKLGVWLSDGDPYCLAEHMRSNNTKWSCPINLNWDSYSANEIAGAYPHFAYVDKKSLKCTITANYEAVVEFDLMDYTLTGNSPWTSEQIINSINVVLE